ncbi:unnamed protein product [Closterium sp. NIES-54]
MAGTSALAYTSSSFAEVLSIWRKRKEVTQSRAHLEVTPSSATPCAVPCEPSLEATSEETLEAISESTEKQSQLQVPLSFSAACAVAAEEAEEEEDPRTVCNQMSTCSVAVETSCSNGTSYVSCFVSNDTISGKDVRIHSDGGRWLVVEVAVGSGGATADALC